MKILTINFSELAKEISLRFDVNFIDFNKTEKESTYSFRDFFEIQNFEKKDRLKLLEEIDDDDFYYSEIGNTTKLGDVEPVKLNFNERDELVEDYFKKIEKGDIQKVAEDNILLAKVRPNLKKYIFVDNVYKNYFYTTAFINLKPKKLNKILYYSFRTIFYNDLMAIARQGKGYPTLKEDDLFSLRFNKKIINKLDAQQHQIVSKIEPIEKKIKELKSQIKDSKEIINKVFAREFGFDLEKFEEEKKKKFFKVDLCAMNTSLIRSTIVQNSKSTNYLKCFFKDIKTIYLKNIITKKIQRGKQPEYSKTGVTVIKTANIQNSKITFNDVLQYVSENFYSENKEKAGVEKFDLLLTSTGMGRGKFALYDSKEIAFADSHVSIIRFDNKKLSPYFLNYYSQSFLGIEQLKYIEMHIKGTPEIYEEQLKYFQILDISLTHQQKIVDEIKKELDKQKEMKRKIEKERNKIDEIINKEIK